MAEDNNIDYSSSFEDLQAEFYQYLRERTTLSKKTCGDYISRLKFLSDKYPLDRDLTKERIEEIMRQERIAKDNRDRYNNSHAMADLHSGLMKLLDFVNSDFSKTQEQQEEEEVKKVKESSTLSRTEKEAIVKSRIGQGLFRKRLLEYWHSCAITSTGIPWFLMASHIKPWRNSNNRERLDVYNGLLLVPSYDKLFDKGYISFSPQGRIILSPLLTRSDRQELHIKDDIQLRFITPMHEKYLQYHREHCLLA